MIRTYPGFETAALAVAELRSKGHFAAICDEYSAAFWGAPTIGGVRVISSEDPCEDEVPPLPKSSTLEALLRGLGIVALSLSAIVTAVIAIRFLDLVLTNIVPFLILVTVGLVLTPTVFLIASAIGIGFQNHFRQSLLKAERVESIFDGLLLFFVLWLCYLIFITGAGA